MSKILIVEDEETIADLENYEGTMVCASGLRWRSIDGYMGQNEFYASVT